MLSPDTQATLLLTGRFSKESEAKPLSLAEYNRLAMQLRELQVRPADLLSTIPGELQSDRPRLEKLLSRGTALALAVERWERSGIAVIGRSDEGYPVQFRKKLRSAAAPILFVAGPTDLLETESVCIVGSRDASPSGMEFAARLGRQCAMEKLAVVSGDARGVDRTAMNAALENGGRVVAVLSDSLGRAVVVKRHRTAIAAGQLVLLSPYDPDANFSVANAMDRNKYLYALGSLALIVDSDVKGGTWTGALENKKHVWTNAFVRLAPDAPPGNQKLAQHGIPIFPNAPHPLRYLQSAYTENEPLPGGNDEAPTTEADSKLPQTDNHSVSLFDAFVAQLTEWIEGEPRTEAAIADHFDLERTQVKVWLDRAQREERVKKMHRPVRYSALSQATAKIGYEGQLPL